MPVIFQNLLPHTCLFQKLGPAILSKNVDILARKARRKNVVLLFGWLVGWLVRSSVANSMSVCQKVTLLWVHLKIHSLPGINTVVT